HIGARVHIEVSDPLVHFALDDLGGFHVEPLASRIRITFLTAGFVFNLSVVERRIQRFLESVDNSVCEDRMP
ncbi:MAG: hypothetical protein ACTMKZ_12790, partial [Brevibacterium aurantiacum]|uniref:hypothetical protein n=1 Tax=Brevibacterium aurantiacum TaxID=273384 RepID=UPI003F8E073A